MIFLLVGCSNTTNESSEKNTDSSQNLSASYEPIDYVQKYENEDVMISYIDTLYSIDVTNPYEILDEGEYLLEVEIQSNEKVRYEC